MLIKNQRKSWPFYEKLYIPDTLNFEISNYILPNCQFSYQYVKIETICFTIRLPVVL